MNSSVFNKLESLALLSRCSKPEGRPHEWDSTRGLAELVLSLPRLDRVVELGSYKGVSTEVFALLCGSVMSVDWWQDRDIFAEYLRFAHRYPNVSLVQGQTRWEAQRIADGTLDFVYIDADHSHEAVTNDIESWLPKIKFGHWIGGHDYSEPNPGVISAVNRAFGKPDAVFPDSSWLVRIHG